MKTLVSLDKIRICMESWKLKSNTMEWLLIDLKRLFWRQSMEIFGKKFPSSIIYHSNDCIGSELIFTLKDVVEREQIIFTYINNMLWQMSE
jgi:hypothetical protein